MADIVMKAAPVLGTDLKLGGNTIRERADVALVSVATPQGGEADLAAAMHAAWGLDMPAAIQTSAANGTRAIRTAPDQIMLAFAHDRPDANALVQGALKGTGYTTDQTDAWIVLELEGPDTAAALARLCPLDLDAAVFPDGAAARTVMEHMGALVVRLGHNHMWLLSASSSAGSFVHAVETSFHNVI